MSNRNYWLDLFTVETWEEFLAAGAKVSGFRESRQSTVQKIRPGDYLLCYLTQISRWVGVLEVTSEAYCDASRIWKTDRFPCRLKVKVLAKLTPETGIPVRDLTDLSFFQNMVSPHAWTGRFRGSPAKWKSSDGEAVTTAILEAVRNPVQLPIPKRIVRATATAEDLEPVADGDGDEINILEPDVQTRSTTDHEEIQWLLLKLGSDMGLDVWVARNDRGRSYNGHAFRNLRGIREDLPRQFDESTSRTIELIDVLWLQSHAIVAAFEIESTTSIYSGLLRMSDLVAMQPNLNIPLYIVAPDERANAVCREINRPTFAKRTPPLRDVCKFISFSTLRENVIQVAPYVRHLKPDFLEDLAQECVTSGDL
jgi:hypothetical protein